ncbi:MAG: IS91 family transposase [Proteobacteria bacterium]|nr:IS91 family transposase [Pseudomonadota bacterium]
MADIFCKYGKAYIESHPMPLEHYKIMNAIVVCRTAALGGHVEVCDSCGKTQNSYNSCRNRHCPKCQALTKARWLEARQAELLCVPYFHNVFTLPHELNLVILCNKKIMLDILFRAVSATLKEFAENPKSRYKEGGKIGFTSILHTWDQNLRGHFHLHCVIPAGYLSHDGERWIHSKKKFLFPVKALSRVFRGKFIEQMELSFNDLIFPGKIADIGTDAGFRKLKKQLYSKEWVVYSKQPFGGPKQVLEYLGRYTHRVAISNNRILDIENNTITFSYKDRKNNDTKKIMALDANEFIRRFLLHALPKKFMRIRHSGFLANRCKKGNLLKCRKILGQETIPDNLSNKSPKDLMLDLTGLDISTCPFCKKGKLNKMLKIPEQTGPGFFERLNLTSLKNTS